MDGPHITSSTTAPNLTRVATAIARKPTHLSGVVGQALPPTPLSFTDGPCADCEADEKQDSDGEKQPMASDSPPDCE